ncbi:hypothetical protein K504DRAFT_495284 [Pleomassaria siparia CBS 279.74]|uniref:Protein kinase domain-containing protein n=1 Tax=Pleomassaria siparia CBS 279.74 TaxID=1314801 RepID=A0A6G1JT00_9PLEO|nr:hypothetical protein K504DRAFT_495284 [Pleomassaria siparia CBS 279.74]
MAAPTVLNGDIYVFVDNDDQTMYDTVLDPHQRLAFLMMMTYIISNKPNELLPNGTNITGEGVKAMWKGKKAYWLRKLGKRIADNHIIPPAQPTAVAEAVAGPADPAGVGNSGDTGRSLGPGIPGGGHPRGGSPAPDDILEEGEKDSADSPGLRTPRPSPAAPDDEDLGGERSPTFLLHNRPPEILISPTRGMRNIAYTRDAKRWRFARTLYQRAIWRGNNYHPGSSYLFVRVGEDGNIVDEAVMKCSKIDLARLGKGKEFNQKNVAEREIIVNRALRKTNCSHILPFQGSSIRSVEHRINHDLSEKFSYILMWTKFARFGDLSGLMEKHEHEQTAIPEHFIWYTISSLVEGLFALRDGVCATPVDPEPTSPSDQGAEDTASQEVTTVRPTTGSGTAKAPESPSTMWKPIIHNDIKHLNVFLGEGNNMFPGYKSVYLADFDLALPLSRDLKERGRDLESSRYSGTIHWQPPEKCALYRADSEYQPGKWPLSYKGDIWSLGILALRMMLCGVWSTADSAMVTEAAERAWKDAPNSSERKYDDNYLPQFGYAAFPEEYTIHLLKTVMQCLQLRPRFRPTLERLREEAAKGMARVEAMCGDQLRKGEAIAGSMLLFNESDNEFRVGSRFEPPHKRRKPNERHEKYDESSELYGPHVESWNSKGWTTATLEQQRDVLSMWANDRDTAMKDALDQHEYIPTFAMDLQLCWTYARNTMAKVLDPEGVSQPFDQLYEIEPYTPWAFSRWMKELVLFHSITWAQSTTPSPTDPNREGLQTLNHAMEWGFHILRIGEMPNDPKLEGMSKVHSGVLDFVRQVPILVRKK